MRIIVYCTFDFEALHQWADAPDDVSYLRNQHRHVFKVRVEALVADSDREVEFISMKTTLRDSIAWVLKNEQTDFWSCEHWAVRIRDLADQLDYDTVRVQVSEDGENGALIEV